MSTMNVPPPTSGPVAGNFQLVGLIGRGGMGSVWEARHQTLGTRVAIKFIEAEYADSQEARSRFDREARAAATIESKHAIKIYDHGVTPDGKPFIVMELLVGEPLDKRIERMRQLSVPDTARILQQVCRGLQRAHDHGIVHRDLKPENIFLVRSPDDDEEVVKVLDFGIAKIQNGPHSGGMTSSTKTGAVLGTPYYMSPEQARGLRNVDHRTDLWSIGVIAYKCVTGRLPFDGESVGDLLVKICTSPVPLPSHAVPGLPSSFDAWFVRALERDPERRFQSAQELGDALAYAAGISTRAPVSSAHSTTPYTGPGGTMPSVPGPHGAQVPGMMTPAGGVMGAATPAPAGMTAAPFTSSRAGAESGSRWKVVVGAAMAGLLLGGGAIAGTALYRQDKGPSRGGAGLAMSATSTPTQGPAATAALPSLTAEDTSAAGAGASASAAIGTTAAPAVSAVVPAKATGTPRTTRPAAPSKTPATVDKLDKPAATATATATAAPPPPAVTAKKQPPSKDPGY